MSHPALQIPNSLSHPALQLPNSLSHPSLQLPNSLSHPALQLPNSLSHPALQLPNSLSHPALQLPNSLSHPALQLPNSLSHPALLNLLVDYRRLVVTFCCKTKHNYKININKFIIFKICCFHFKYYSNINIITKIQSHLYIKGTQGNLKMCPFYTG